MNTHDPAFRRAFRRGKKFFGWRGAFSVARLSDGSWIPLPYIPENPLTRKTLLEPGIWAAADGQVVSVDKTGEGIEIKVACPSMVIYWNPDGKRWRRFDPDKMNKYINQEART